MSWPNVNGFGVKYNPLVFSPFDQNNGGDDSGFMPGNAFLLLTGADFTLLNGGFFLLLES